MRKAIHANAVAYYAYFILSSLMAFITSPLLISYLGGVGFGAFKSTQKLLDIASVADGRSGQALKWTIARKAHEGDEANLSRACASAVQATLVFTPLLVLIVCALVYFAGRLINVPSGEHVVQLRLLMTILGANFILAPLLAIPDAVLVGSNRGYISTAIQLAWFALTNIGMVLAARYGYGIVGLAWIIICSSILNAACVFAVSKRTTPWFKWTAPHKGDFGKFVGLSGWLLVWAGVEKVLLSGEIVLIAMIIGAGAASSYVVNAYVVQLILAVLLSTVSAGAPSLGKLIASDSASSRIAVIAVREGVFAVSVLGAAFLVLFNESFVALWVGPQFYMGGISNLMLAILMVQVALIRCDAQIGDLTLNVSSRSMVGALATVLTVVLPFLAVLLMGKSMLLVLAGVFVARLILTAYSSSTLRGVLSVPRINPRAGIFAVLLLGGSYWLSSFVEISAWWQLAGLVALFVPVSLIYVSSFVISSPTRAAVLAYLGSRAR